MIKKKSIVKKVHSKPIRKTKKVSHKPRITQTSSEVKVEKILIENFVSLQKVMTHLSLKFDSLTNQISKLLELFEISAKSLSKKDFNLDREARDDTQIIEKLENLADQNKTIARGLTLMHEKAPQEEPSGFPLEPKPLPQTQPIRPLPPFRKLIPSKPKVEKEEPQQNVDSGEYQKSISSKSEFQ